MTRAVLIQIDGWDPVAGAAVTLRMASHDDPALCLLNGQVWWPVLGRLPVLNYDLFDGAFDGGISAPATSFSCAIEPWANFSRFILADARTRIWLGELGAAWGAFTLLFDGRATAQPQVQSGLATLDIAVDDRWLDVPLLPTYAGTGGAEGLAAMLGVVKPLALGAPRYVPGRLIDPANSVYQVSGCGAIESVEYALDQLVRLPAPTADYGSYAALIGATIAPGEVATCLAQGMVRHGAPAAGKVSYLVRGDKAGPDGWARKPGQLIRRIALLSGGTGKIADASLNALDTARPYNQSLFIDQQATARDLIQSIAASVNAVAGVSWLGQLFVQPVGFGTATLTLAADGSAMPPVASVQQVAMGSPFWKLAMLAERTWSVHDLANDVATADPIPATITATSEPATGLPGQMWFNPTNGATVPWDPVLGFGGPAIVDLNAQLTADGAQSTANAAAANATAALATLTDIASDNLLTPVEKPQVVLDRDVIVAEQSGLDAQAAALSITTERTSYNNAVNALTSYLATLTTPVLWSDVTGNTSIAGATFRSKFADVYAARQTLMNRMVEATSAATERVEGPSSLAFSADFTGVVTPADQLPARADFKRFRGADNVSGSTTWSIASQGGITGGTVTVSGGTVTIPSGVSIPPSTSITVRAVRDGITIDTLVAVSKSSAPPPVTGGGGAGTTVSDSTMGSITSTSFTVISDVLTVKTGSAGQISLVAAGFETIAAAASPTGNFAVELRWRYQPVGGSWTDLSASASVADALVESEAGVFFAERGSVTSSPTVTGLSASTDYEVQLMARRTSSSPSKAISFAGSAIAVGS